MSSVIGFSEWATASTGERGTASRCGRRRKLDEELANHIHGLSIKR